MARSSWEGITLYGSLCYLEHRDYLSSSTMDIDPKPLKRHLSPVSLPPAKRQHGARPYSSKCIITFDNALYDELILFIFSFLNSRDLCAIQATNKNCCRLSCDHQVLEYILVKEGTHVEHPGCNTVSNSSFGRPCLSEILTKPAFGAGEGFIAEPMAAY
jgi:hypothetical protein